MHSYLADMVKQMAPLFNMDELQILCLGLAVDWEELAGQTKSSKICALLLHLGQTGRLQALIAALQQERPLVDWPAAPDTAVQTNFAQGDRLRGYPAFAAFSQGVTIMDQVGEAVVAYANQQPATAVGPHTAVFQARDGLIVRHSPFHHQSITPEQFQERLSPDDLAHIHTLAHSMEQHYQQWQTLYPQRNALANAEQNKLVQGRLEALVQEIAHDLGRIIHYLDKLGFMLDDHYFRYRDLAEQYGYTGLS